MSCSARLAQVRFIRTPAGQDLGGVLLLVLVSIGLGIYARAGRDSSSAPGIALTHPVFSLVEFRVLAESRHIPILDARHREDYQRGHVPGALSLPVEDFETEYPKLEQRLGSGRGDLIIVYCANMWCGLGDELQKKLIDRGFQHVGRFPDGWEAWQHARLPEEKAP
jgi:rhodanese-related sulfurtransferase